MSKRKNRLSTDGGDPLAVNPFGSLSSEGLKSRASSPAEAAPKKKKSRGRVDVKREKAGRGGKTVTVVYGMQNIELRERSALLKKIKSSCAAGGALKGGNLEVQGDNRDAVRRILEDAGFQVVFAGG